MPACPDAGVTQVHMLFGELRCRMYIGVNIGAMDEKMETITSQGTYTGFISLGCRASGSEGLILNT